MFTTLVIVTALVLGLLLYNTLVKLRNQVLAAWADIDVQLKRRHDLVPQLVNAVKAYSDYERSTMTLVTELRTRSEAAKQLTDKARFEAGLEQAMHTLVAVAEAYPELKADQNFRQLQNDLVDTEEQLQYARRYYNGAVRLFNTQAETFPGVLIARLFGFKRADYFEVDEAAQRLNPDVDLA